MKPTLIELLTTLAEAQVEFVLAGGLAAVAQGAPVMTFDVAIVHRRTPANVDRLWACLARLHAFVREPGQRRLAPDRTALLGAGHLLLVTDLGPLDCLGAVEKGLTYDELIGEAVTLEIAGRSIAVVPLARLVEFKEQWTDDESKLRASIMRRALAVQRASKP